MISEYLEARKFWGIYVAMKILVEYFAMYEHFVSNNLRSEISQSENFGVNVRFFI